MTCNCRQCLEAVDPNIIFTQMILCPQCGDKRCPHAFNHRYICLKYVPQPQNVNTFDNPMSEISRASRVERDRCISLVWEHRGKCASNSATLALMAILNGDT